MIFGRKALGRPYYVADIPFENDRQIALLTEFYSIAKRLCYRDIVALARAFSMTERTVYAWHYGERFPRYDIMIDVIEWAKRGKPMRKEYQKSPLFSML
jgi:hypothetical protein